jgi:hypothetical protein
MCPPFPPLDVVILASSILSTESVLRSLPVQRLKRSTLIVDVLSVKVGRAGQGGSWRAAGGQLPGGGRAGLMQTARSRRCCGRLHHSSQPRWHPPSSSPHPCPHSSPPHRPPPPSPPPQNVQVFPKQLFLRELPPELDILCTHPMFGPDSGRGSWQGLNFMFEKVGAPPAAVLSCQPLVWHGQGNCFAFDSTVLSERTAPLSACCARAVCGGGQGAGTRARHQAAGGVF